MNGTRSTAEGYARRASTSGLRPSASRAPAGRRLPIGMRSKLFSYSGRSPPPYSKCIERYYAALGFVCIADRS